MLTCPRCGSEEPDGSRFCGSCGAPFVVTAAHPDRPEPTEAETPILRRCTECGAPAEADAVFCGECGSALPPDSSPAEPTAEEPALVDPGTPPSPRGRPRRGWIAAGAAVVVLVAGGAAAAVVLLSDGDGTTEAMTTEETFPTTTTTTTTESLPPAPSPTLVESVHDRYVEVVGYQTALGARVRFLDARPESFTALQQTATALAISIRGTLASLDGFVPADTTEAQTLVLLRSALASHLAYAQSVAAFPSRPAALTSVQAQAVIEQEEQTQDAYARLAAAEPSLSHVLLDGNDHVRLLALVPEEKPPQPIAVRRVVSLAPLLVGIRPDDSPGEGRCFGPYTSRASLTVSGVVYRSGFVQCGDDGAGDPTRASGIYRFSGSTVPTATGARFTAQAAIDESSASSQRGSSVTWTVFYAGTPICSTTVVWGGSRQTPKELDCRVPRTGSFDVGRLRIEQIASLASTGDFWAGLLNPTIVVTST